MSFFSCNKCIFTRYTYLYDQWIPMNCSFHNYRSCLLLLFQNVPIKVKSFLGLLFFFTSTSTKIVVKKLRLKTLLKRKRLLVPEVQIPTRKMSCFQLLYENKLECYRNGRTGRSLTLTFHRFFIFRKTVSLRLFGFF